MRQRLLPVSPGDPALDLVAAGRALAAAGVEGLILREPSCDVLDLIGLIDALLPALPGLVLHDRCPDARALARARGLPLHLPAGALPPEAPTPWGASTHSLDEALAAQAAGAAWVLLSPVARPVSKPEDDRPPLGVEGLARAQAALALPVFALGGVTPALARRLRTSGVFGVASLGGVFGGGVAGVAARARSFLQAVA